MERLKPTLVHGSVVPEIDDSFSPDAIDFVGSIIMKGLSCTFTWYTRIRIFEDHELDELVDRLPVSSSTWQRIIELCHIAISYHIKGDLRKSKSFLAESFIPLLEVHGIKTNCAFTNKNREALKHVLDSTSAFIQLSSCDDHEAHRNLYNYAKTITSLDSMDKSQRAAVHAIRSRLSDYPDNMLYAMEAVKLDPEEGRWHFYLADALYQADKTGKIQARDSDEAFKGIMKHNQMSLNLCQDFLEPMLMAEILVTDRDPESCDKTYESVKNVLKKFPNSAYAYMRAADIFHITRQLSDFIPKSYILIVPFYQKAIELAGKECALLRHKLGLHQVLMAETRLLKNYKEMYKEGIKNLKLAALTINEAKMHLLLEERGLLDSLALGIPPLWYWKQFLKVDDDGIAHLFSEFNWLSNAFGLTPLENKHK